MREVVTSYLSVEQLRKPAKESTELTNEIEGT